MTPRTQQWAALGTYAQIVVDSDDLAPDALIIAQRLVSAIDVTCSRFRPDSDLCRANARAGEWVRVDPLLVRAVDAAVHAACLTDGLVDPTLGRHLAALGYDRDLRLVRTQPQPSVSGLEPPAAAAARWRQIRTDGEGGIRVPAGCALDLGATGKAFGADLVADAIVDQLGCSVIVSLGGDVAARSLDASAGWQVLVSDTDGGDLDAPGQVVSLQSGGMATSSTRHRRWRRGDVSVHHIVDPRTGAPATEKIVTATVCAATCVEANAASTAAIILGVDAAPWLETRNLSALLIDNDGTVTRCAAWPSRDRVGVLC